MLKCLWNKIRHLVKLTYVTTAQQDGNNFYNAQTTYMGAVNQSIIWYPYGMAANTPINTMGLTFNVTCNQDNQVTFPYSIDNRFLGLKSGEVILGNGVKQTFIKFDEDGNVTISSDATVTITGDLEVTGDITAKSTSDAIKMSEIKSTFNTHVHLDNNEPPTTQI